MNKIIKLNHNKQKIHSEEEKSLIKVMKKQHNSKAFNIIAKISNDRKELVNNINNLVTSKKLPNWNLKISTFK